MSKCGFEDDLGNGMKAGLVGLALGAIGWIVFGALGKGKSYAAADTSRQRRLDEAERRRKEELEYRRAEKKARYS